MIICFLFWIGKITGDIEFPIIATIILLTMGFIIFREMRQHETWHEHLMEFPGGLIEARFKDELKKSGVGDAEAAFWGHAARIAAVFLIIIVI